MSRATQKVKRVLTAYLELVAMYLVCIVIVLTVGHTAGPNNVANTLPATGNVAGFGLGIWHGLVCGVTFLISLFSDSVHMYEVHNNGGWYDFGFLSGVIASLWGSKKSTF